MKRVILVVGLLLLAAATAQADGRAKIWLGIPGSTDINANSDPWLSESALFAGNEGAFNFDLDAINKLKNGTIYDSHLVLAIPNDAPNSSWSIDINGTAFNYADFSGTGLHPYLSPHGIFANNNGALWMEYVLGDLTAGNTLTVPVNVTGAPSNLMFHFDAYGSSSATSQDGHYFAPYSHDATVTAPEPVSTALFLLGGAVMAARKLRKNKQGEKT